MPHRTQASPKPDPSKYTARDTAALLELARAYDRTSAAKADQATAPTVSPQNSKTKK